MSRILLACAALSLLAGCGLRDGLEGPPPLWGNPDEPSDEEKARDAENTPGVGSESSAIPIPTP
jgi:predicted small lipoprotein YifL